MTLKDIDMYFQGLNNINKLQEDQTKYNDKQSYQPIPGIPVRIIGGGTL